MRAIIVLAIAVGAVAVFAAEPVVRVAIKTPKGIVIEPRSRFEAGLPTRDEARQGVLFCRCAVSNRWYCLRRAHRLPQCPSRTPFPRTAGTY
jgi:hypothetical protein